MSFAELRDFVDLEFTASARTQGHGSCGVLCKASKKERIPVKRGLPVSRPYSYVQIIG